MGHGRCFGRAALFAPRSLLVLSMMRAGVPPAGPLRAPGSEGAMSGLTLGWGGLAAALAVLVAFPLVITNALYTQFGVLTLIFVASVIAWNMFSGYSGYISLGHAVFFGTAAYAVGLLTEHWHLNGSQIF